MSKVKLVAGWLVASVLLMTDPALAYVGPGAGITLLGSLWGLLAAILLALGAVLYLPIRSLLRKRRKRQEHTAAAEHAHATSSVHDGPSQG